MGFSKTQIIAMLACCIICAAGGFGIGYYRGEVKISDLRAEMQENTINAQLANEQLENQLQEKAREAEAGNEDEIKKLNEHYRNIIAGIRAGCVLSDSDDTADTDQDAAAGAAGSVQESADGPGGSDAGDNGEGSGLAEQYARDLKKMTRAERQKALEFMAGVKIDAIGIARECAETSIKYNSLIDLYNSIREHESDD